MSGSCVLHAYASSMVPTESQLPVTSGKTPTGKNNHGHWVSCSCLEALACAPLDGDASSTGGLAGSGAEAEASLTAARLRCVAAGPLASGLAHALLAALDEGNDGCTFSQASQLTSQDPRTLTSARPSTCSAGCPGTCTQAEVF